MGLLSLHILKFSFASWGAGFLFWMQRLMHRIQRLQPWLHFLRNKSREIDWQQLFFMWMHNFRYTILVPYGIWLYLLPQKKTYSTPKVQFKLSTNLKPCGTFHLPSQSFQGARGSNDFAPSFAQVLREYILLGCGLSSPWTQFCRKDLGTRRHWDDSQLKMCKMVSIHFI